MPKGSLSSRITPMLQQFYQLKAEAPDAILFFRMGDFYELFDDDATLVAPILGIVLTAREKGDQSKVPFCGVPHHSYSHYLWKLLKLGHKVAIADQLPGEEDGAGLMTRAIVRIHTLACTDDMRPDSDQDSHSLLAVYECPERRLWHFLLCDYATSDLRFGVVDTFDDITNIAEIYQPKEFLVRRFHKPAFVPMVDRLKESGALLSELPEDYLGVLPCVSHELPDASWERTYARLAPTLTGLCTIPDTDNNNKACEASLTACQSLLAGLLSYFHSLKASTAHFKGVKSLHAPDRMYLHENTIRGLELFVSMNTGKSHGSLWRLLNQCQTAMGARLLKARLLQPYLQKESINRSFDITERLLAEPYPTLTAEQKRLKKVSDVERLSHRLVQKKIQPSQLALLRSTLNIMMAVEQVIESTFMDKGPESEISVTGKFFAGIAGRCRSVAKVSDHLNRGICDEPGQLGSGSQVIRQGYNNQLDELRSWWQEGDDELESFQAALRSELGIPSLKIRAHKTYGYLIEITKTHSHKVPPELILKQTMVNSQRYTSPRLEELAERVSSAQDKAEWQERKLYDDLVNALAVQSQVLLDAAAVIADWDLALSMAVVATKCHFTRPTIDPDGDLELIDSFHPVVMKSMPAHRFTPNSLTITRQQKCLLITGPNMGGKSTIMRQTALSVLLCQIGCYVPARQAQLPIFDGIYTRIGASDDLWRGRSTFMVEMNEAAEILNKATPSSLIVLDELGRGTSTEDGLALAWSLLKEFAGAVNGWVLFATHYHELAHKASQIPEVKLMQTEVISKQGKLHFSYKLAPGVCSHSFGLETARLAGIPPHVLAEAKKELQLLNKPTVVGASRHPQSHSSSQLSP
ncbi:MAG: DNA mismatch repair protein MutS, partial [Proteobacteria bacterium]|nr:DNA mismatch repair protein MutS [Pseudomonadota bacterium]